MFNLSYGWCFEVYIIIGMQEDDGLGGRRKKKGIMVKIKEKLLGYYGFYQIFLVISIIFVYDVIGIGVVYYEKKGIMEKIKEKFFGGYYQINFN